MAIANATYICGGDTRPEPRGDCPNTLHDWPLPSGYVDASVVAGGRLARQWVQKRCESCGLLGWVPGRIDGDIRVTVDTKEQDS